LIVRPLPLPLPLRYITSLMMPLDAADAVSLPRCRYATPAHDATVMPDADGGAAK